MEADLNLGALDPQQLMRLAKLIEGLAESKRSEAFNRFLFWTAREIEREVRSRRLKILLHHVANADVPMMHPGELLLLRRCFGEWETEFGQYAIGQLAELFWQASATFSCSLGTFQNTK